MNDPRHKLSVTRTIATQCPACGVPINATGEFKDGVGPAPGDFSVCLRCAQPLELTEGLGVRVLSSHELARMQLFEGDAYEALMEMVTQVERSIEGFRED